MLHCSTHMAYDIFILYVYNYYDRVVEGLRLAYYMVR